TVRTLAEGLTLRQAALGPTYAVLDGRVDLLVDRVVSCPASSHVALLKRRISLPRYWWQMAACQARCAERPSAPVCLLQRSQSERRERSFRRGCSRLEGLSDRAGWEHPKEHRGPKKPRSDVAH